ncbi:carboxylesterase [Lysinibacillus sp. BF-4]|uniref:alpha/beta hydrolase n=1 Tax=Lysinibacillus sp. BF-4 TaxID=1473546 RepID=UPI0005031DBE|nr:alpha/beta fold hydrolase [Lysinibacillus sp. BF-4]KFL42744.1 carboxylesterase [Lysinibacillus sp. BF-4]
MTTGILYLHGFSGGTYEIAPLQNYLAQYDYATKAPTLTGHGEVLDLRRCKAEHWLKDAELSYRKLAKRVDDVIVVGFSMGGVLALYLAQRYPVKKLVLLSAALNYIEPKQLVKDVAIFATAGYQVKMNPTFQRYAFKFGKVPLSAALAFTRVVQLTAPYVKNITVPTLIVQGQLDGMVPYTTANKIYTTLASYDKRLYFSPNGKHHICFSDDCEKWFAKVAQFVNDKSLIIKNEA